MLTNNFNKKKFPFKLPPISIGIGTFIIFAAIIGLYSFHKYDLVPPQQANIAAIGADSQKIKGDVEEAKRLTLEAAKAHIVYQKAREQQKGQALSLLQQILRQRKDQLIELTEKDPAKVLKLLLPKNIREALPKEVSEDIESDITTEGILAIFHEDDFDALKSKTNYILQSSWGDFSLHTPRQFGDLVSNTKIHVKGVRIGNKIIINDPDKELKILQKQIFSSSESKSSTNIIKRILRRQEARAITDDTFGDQKTAVILVNFLDDTSQPWTPAYVRGVIFDNPDSVNAYYKEISFNQTSLSGGVFGWYTLPISATCSISTIFNEAIKVSDPDIYFPPYSRIIIAFPRLYPRLSGCTWAGAGTVGQTTFSSADGSYLVASETWINGFMTLRVAGHEFGHNLGVYHASGYDCDAGVLEGTCTTWEYGDPFDVMGRSLTGHHNSPHKDYLKWLTAAGGAYQVTSNGTYTLEPLEAAGGTKMLEIPKDTDKSKWYFLEYRQATGFDSYLSSNSNVTNGLLVHYGPYASGKSYTRLLDMTPGTADFNDAALIIGTTYTDKITGTSFTPLGKTETGIQVKVKLPPTICVQANPTISISPISQWGSAESPLSYTVNVTNNDNYLCSSSTFTLASAVPAGWTSKFDISSLTLASGATGSATITVTSPAATSDGFYDFSVSATNSAAPTYNSSATATYVVADVNPPTVSITSPTNGSTVSGSRTVSADASDDRGVAGVQFKLNGSNLGAEDTTAPYVITWNTTTASNGSHTLTAIARDITGNLTTSSDVAVIVNNLDTVSPAVSITSPANGTTIKRGSTVTISASASDNIGVIKVEFYVNSTLTCTDTATPYSCAWKVPMAKGKVYTLQAKAYDAAGNRGSSSTVKVTAK